MRRFIDNLGVFHLLLDGETPQETWTEVIDQYKRYKAPNGDIHTILFDAEPEEDWVEDNIEYLQKKKVKLALFSILKDHRWPKN